MTRSRLTPVTLVTLAFLKKSRTIKPRIIKPMMNPRTVLAILLLLITTAGPVAAQTTAAAKPNPQEEKGFTSYAEFGGSSNSDGQVYELNSSVGYNFSQHFGMDVAVPIYFVHASSSTAGGSTSNNGLGNPHVDLRLKFSNPAVNYGSVLTGWVPTADTKKGLSTGRATFDWTNRFDRSFSRLTPFAEAGIGNTIADSRLFIRPFTSLGFNAHFQAGANFDLWKFFSVGASAYDILPSGQQTIFSKLVKQQPGGNSNSSHGRVFENNAQTTGTAAIARDNGYSTWVDASPNRYLDMELGYTHSVHYALNTVSFSVGVNIGQLARSGARH